MQWIDLLKHHKTLVAAGAICISTCTMAILEPCIPMWLMAHFDPPPTKWQLGAVFIPDSIGYFLGSHLTGKKSVCEGGQLYFLFYLKDIVGATLYITKNNFILV